MKVFHRGRGLDTISTGQIPGRDSPPAVLAEWVRDYALIDSLKKRLTTTTEVIVHLSMQFDGIWLDRESHVFACRVLRGSTRTPSLPDVAPLVSGNHVNSGGHAKPDAGKQRIRE